MSDTDETNETDSATTKKKVPTRVWVVSGVLVFGLILQSCGGDTPDAAEDESTSESETVVEEEVEAAEPDVEEETTPEVEEETEPEVELSVDDIREVVMPLVFDSSRTGILEIINDLGIVETVDLYAYDADLGLVDMDVSPAYDFEPGVRDDAWEIFRLFSVFYKEPDGAWLSENPRFAPELRVTISTATYQCDADVMRDLSDAMLSRSAWQSACKVR